MDDGRTDGVQQDQDQERDHRGRGDPDRLSLLTQNLKYFSQASPARWQDQDPITAETLLEKIPERKRRHAMPCHVFYVYARPTNTWTASRVSTDAAARIASVPIPAAFEHCTSVSRLSTASRLRPGLFLRLRQDLPTQPLYVCIGLPRRAWATDPQDAAAWSPADILQTQRCSVGGSIRGEN
mgnify:FL=1